MKEPVYFQRYAWKERLFDDFIPDSDLGLIVIIPCFKEPALKKALDSINKCKSPSKKVLIIVLVNESENADNKTLLSNENTIDQLKNYQSRFELLFKRIKLPGKKAGVGLARKIAMDEAAFIFNQIHQDGIIVNYDADCTCAENYLQVIEKSFSGSYKSGIVFYEHSSNGSNQQEIIQYELYLRYYVDSLRFTGFPYAHQTLGSCIVVKSSLYQKIGGMNTRKAGEDFYFLNKTMPHGDFIEINDTTIYPSDRTSDRVPFGTGKAIKNLLEDDSIYRVYNPQCFIDLKSFFDEVESYWESDSFSVPLTVKSFLGDQLEKDINEIKNAVSTFEGFKKRFFHWFDAFKILKFVHYSRDNYYPNIDLEEAVKWLFDAVNIEFKNEMIENLTTLREFDRSLNQIK